MDRFKNYRLIAICFMIFICLPLTTPSMGHSQPISFSKELVISDSVCSTMGGDFYYEVPEGKLLVIEFVTVNVTVRKTGVKLLKDIMGNVVQKPSTIPSINIMPFLFTDPAYSGGNMLFSIPYMGTMVGNPEYDWFSFAQVVKVYANQIYIAVARGPCRGEAKFNVAIAGYLEDSPFLTLK